jgi:Ca2+:H+ antiporter
MDLYSYLKGSSIHGLLIFIPVSLGLQITGYPELWVFITSCLGIIPLSKILGDATEEMSKHTGPGIGGLLNATFGNATELIIALFALHAGLYEVVKASLAGSIIGNLLLVLGFSMLLGGIGREKQTFNRTGAAAGASMLFLAVAALIMPAVFNLTLYGNLKETNATVQFLSLLVAIVLIVSYVFSLIFSLVTHRDIYDVGDEEDPAVWGKGLSALIMGVVTVFIAIESELLVKTIEETTKSLGVSQFFVGMIIVAIVGNAAEHSAAVWMARKNKMDISLSIAIGSSTQIALLVAPLLVFASFLFGNPMSLVFNAFEIVAVTLSVVIVALVTLDGESHWFEGLQLIAVYLVLAIAFYFVP